MASLHVTADRDTLAKYKIHTAIFRTSMREPLHDLIIALGSGDPEAIARTRTRLDAVDGPTESRFRAAIKSDSGSEPWLGPDDVIQDDSDPIGG